MSTPSRAVRPRPTPTPSRDLAAEVVSALRIRPRAIPSAWFYDARGSRLFRWIAKLPGYYLTRTERAILTAHRDAIVAPLAGAPCTVVDLGAGDGHKTHLLLERLSARSSGVTYAPVDVSRAALEQAGARVRTTLPRVSVRPVRAAFGEALRRLGRAGAGRRLVLFLGSSIGNLEHAAATSLLRAPRAALRSGDHVLVGFDLVKSLAVLEAAYDDPQGVTREFNLNLLARANRELGATFDLAAFRHRATWDPGRPAMESWLESLRDQTVDLAGVPIHLGAGERIHTEISCKYTDGQISGFALAAGFSEVDRFRDASGWFADALWRVP
jgi:dimethylhistidine N-methyltransferase